MSKAAVKQKRISRNSAIIDDALRQAATIKKLYLSSHVCTIYRADVTRLEPFSEQKAIMLVNKYHRKRQAHCTGKLYEDRFTLEKSKSRGVAPFRTWVSYKEIKHVYCNRSKPEYFVLCIDSSLSRRRYYEVYKCKSVMDCNGIQERIKQALDDPDKIIRDPNAIRTEKVSEDSRVRSMIDFEYQKDDNESVRPSTYTNSRYENSTYEISLERLPSPRPVSVQQRTIVSARPQSPIYIQRPPSPVTVQNVYPVRQSNYSAVAPVNADPDGKHDVIYISYDSKRMARASNSGPIYLYSLSTNQKFLPGRSNWGSTEHIDRNLNAAPYADVERTYSMPDVYVRPQEERISYAQPSYRSPSPVFEYQQPVRSYQPVQQPNEVVLVMDRPMNQSKAAPVSQLMYNQKDYINGGADEDELSDLTYISFDPNKGAVISDRGPVYMYRKNYRKSSADTNTSGPTVMNGLAKDWVY